MDLKESQLENNKLTFQFSQFVIAVNGALIAYAFKQVEGKSYSFTLIPLGIAIVFWALSFYCGISTIRKYNRS